MSRYTGLPPKLKQAVFARDNFRCRWCGVTNAWAYDAHHIQYRRGPSFDVLDNLITLCRTHHDFVHDSFQIPKPRAQEILSFLVSEDGMGQTGAALLRRGDMPVHDPGNRRLLVSAPPSCGCPHAPARHHRGHCLAPGCGCPS